MERKERAERDDLIRRAHQNLISENRDGRRPSTSEIQRRMERLDPIRYRSWRTQHPSEANRLRLISRVCAARPGPNAPTRLKLKPVGPWPIGPRQRSEFSPGLPEGPARGGGSPIPVLYLHHYGDKPIRDVWIVIGDDWFDFIPKIGPGESAEVDWPEDGIERYAERVPGRERTEFDFRVEYFEGARVQKLAGAIRVDGEGRPSLFEADDVSFIAIRGGPGETSLATRHRVIR